MNKIESIFYFEIAEIPTLHVDIIDKSNVAVDVKSIVTPNRLGWVARSGARPTPAMRSVADPVMPWHATKPLNDYASPELQVEELIGKIGEIYRLLKDDQVVFIHPQRDFAKSGNIRVDDRYAIIEAIAGWPEPLAHGKVDPAVRYIFRIPSLFVEPQKVEGDEGFLSTTELRMLSNYIERRLDYSFLLDSIIEPIVVEFSLGNYRWGYGPSAHDIMAGKAQRFENWYNLARSGRDQSLFGIRPDELSEIVEESFENIASLLDMGKKKLSEETAGRLAAYLSGKYDLNRYERAPTTSMGSRQFEHAAEIFLGFSKSAGEIKGVPESRLRKMLEEEGCSYQSMLFRKHEGVAVEGMPEDSIGFLKWEGYAVETVGSDGKRYIWPTEELMKQKIPTRDVLRV